MNNLWNKLVEQNLVFGDKPSLDAIQIPWYIRVMQGFAGWVAALFIFGFFAAAFSFTFKNPTGGLLVSLGIMCSIGAYLLIRMRKNDFFDQVGMAFSLSGQLMFAIGLFVLKTKTDTAFLLLGIYQLSLAWIIPQYAHRLLSTSFGLLSLLISLNMLGFHGVGSAMIAVLFAFIWVKENNWGEKRELWEPIGFGVAITIIFSSGFLITGKYLLNESVRGQKSWLFYNAEFLSSLLIALVLVNLVIVLLKEYKVKYDSKTAILSLFAALGLVLISFKVYGLSVGVLIVIVGFAKQRITLIVLGALSSISFFSWYYYNLQVSLLIKSITLVILGIALLMAWLAINYSYGKKKKYTLQSVKFQAINKNKWLAAATVFIAIIAINININKKQDLIKNGETLLFKLAPVDPRSIMQGDYMRLRFALSNEITQRINLLNPNKTIPNKQGFAVVEKNSDNVVSFVDLFHNQELTKNQYMIPYKYRNRQTKFTTDAYYFQEGTAGKYQISIYGEYRYANGEMLLVNLVDKDFNVL